MRDNIHSTDVASFVWEFFQAPRVAEVYNLGGGKFGEWQLKGEPNSAETIRVNQYFDEDAAMPALESGKGKGDERWTGKGRFLLPDFQKLTEFLNDLSSSEGPVTTPLPS